MEISSLKLRENFLNEIKNEERYINNQIFKEYFYYQASYKDTQIKNGRIAKYFNEI